MRITTEQLHAHLTRELKPLYTVYGDETLLALEACDRIRARARALGYAERAVLTVDSGFKWSQLAAAGSAQSLFSSRQLLELRVPTGKPGVEGGEALQAYCQALPQDVVTLLYLPALDWRAQKSAWFDTLDRSGIAVEARVISRKALPRWLAGRLQAQGQEADEDTLSFIADRVEGNLMAAYQEVQKLGLLFPAGTVSFEQVREAVLDVARYDVFELGMAMLEGDALRLARMLEGLRAEGEAPPLILWTMAEEIRAIGKVLSGVASGKPLALLWREARIWQTQHQQALQRNYTRFSAMQVAEGLRHAAAIDRIIKGLGKSDVWDELLQLGLRFARSAPANPPTKHGR
ncbi:MAG TPA: DNA polymerase III subunit delta, partial [Burkholderiales bacterium]|nr:DNA polymerase III subunit delta [Burkholderiales bacterium]